MEHLFPEVRALSLDPGTWYPVTISSVEQGPTFFFIQLQNFNEVCFFYWWYHSLSYPLESLGTYRQSLALVENCYYIYKIRLFAIGKLKSLYIYISVSFNLYISGFGSRASATHKPQF